MNKFTLIRGINNERLCNFLDKAIITIGSLVILININSEALIQLFAKKESNILDKPSIAIKIDDSREEVFSEIISIPITEEKIAEEKEIENAQNIEVVNEIPTFEYQWKGKCVTPEFLDKVLAICIYFEEEHQKTIKPDSLMAIFACEAGFDPAAYNPDPKNPSAGLIQFTQAVAESLGTSLEELIEMPAIEQLNYVKMYYENVIINEPDALLETPADLYAIAFMQKAATYDQERPMGVKDVIGYYPELDEDKNDIINKKDLSARIKRIVGAGGYIEMSTEESYANLGNGGGLLK